MRTRRGSTAFVTAVLVACAALASCSSDGDSDADPGAGSDGGAGDAGSSAPEDAGEEAAEEGTTPPPEPTGPCAEGSCEVEVVVGDVVEVPTAYGLGPIEVTGIAGDTVEMVAPVTGSGYSMAGCSGGGGVSSNGGGGVGMSCEVGTVATVNEAMSLEVVEIVDAGAVLRIEPAG